MIATDLSKQQALDTHQKKNKKINFTGNLNRVGEKAMYYITEEAKETILYFP